MARRKQPKKRPGVRYDSRHVKLRTGEGERDDGRYYYRWTDPYGHRHAIYSPTLEELRVREEQILVDRHDGIKTQAANRTLNDLYELWLETKRGIKDSTMQNYQYMYDQFVKPIFGQNRLRNIKRSDVRRFYISLLEDKILKIATLDNVHSVLHQVLQIAVDDDIIRKNPADNMVREMKLVNGDDSVKREALTLDQQKLFLAYMKKTPKYLHWYPIFYIMLNTGMRLGEITGLRHCDIRTEKRTGRRYISVNHTLITLTHAGNAGKKCERKIHTPKTRAGVREIPISDSVWEAFEMEKEYQKEAGITCQAHIDGYTDFIFLNQEGNVLNGALLNKAIHRITRDCNAEILEKEGLEKDPVLLPHFSCHVLRHTFATRAAESGVLAPKTLQSILGHADISTTFNIYVTADESIKAIEITALEKYIETGERAEKISGVKIEAEAKEQKEETDDEGRETGGGAAVGASAADAGRNGSIHGDWDQQTEGVLRSGRERPGTVGREPEDVQEEEAGGIPGKELEHVGRRDDRNDERRETGPCAGEGQDAADG